MPTAFISYRRSDTAAKHLSWYLYNRLKESEGIDAFLDKQVLGPGASLTQEISAAIKRSDIFLSVIGPKWLHCQDKATGQRRIDDAKDWVRQEIEIALSSDTTDVVPVLIDRNALSPTDNLHGRLSDMADLNQVFFTDENWKEQTELIVKSLNMTNRKLRSLLGMSLCAGRDGLRVYLSNLQVGGRVGMAAPNSFQWLNDDAKLRETIESIVHRPRTSGLVDGIELCAAIRIADLLRQRGLGYLGNDVSLFAAPVADTSLDQFGGGPLLLVGGPRGNPLVLDMLYGRQLGIVRLGIANLPEGGHQNNIDTRIRSGRAETETARRGCGLLPKNYAELIACDSLASKIVTESEDLISCDENEQNLGVLQRIVLNGRTITHASGSGSFGSAAALAYLRDHAGSLHDKYRNDTSFAVVFRCKRRAHGESGISEWKARDWSGIREFRIREREVHET